MYYCHRCKKIYDGENTCAVLIEEEVNGIRRTSRLSVCQNCLNEIANEFLSKETPNTEGVPENKGGEN